MHLQCRLPCAFLQRLQPCAAHATSVAGHGRTACSCDQGMAQPLPTNSVHPVHNARRCPTSSMCRILPSRPGYLYLSCLPVWGSCQQLQKALQALSRACMGSPYCRPEGSVLQRALHPSLPRLPAPCMQCVALLRRKLLWPFEKDGGKAPPQFSQVVCRNLGQQVCLIHLKGSGSQYLPHRSLAIVPKFPCYAPMAAQLHSQQVECTKSFTY